MQRLLGQRRYRVLGKVKDARNRAYSNLPQSPEIFHRWKWKVKTSTNVLKCHKTRSHEKYI